MSSVTNTTGTTLNLQYSGQDGNGRNLPYPLDMQLRPYTRAFSGFGKGVIFVEDFNFAQPTFYNDGAGTGYRDPSIPFNGKPSFRLDPGTNTIGITSPGRTANQSGVISKRRIDNLVGTATKTSSVFGQEQWIRWTSNNNGPGSNVMTSMSIYNRDGTNVWIGRLWVDTTTDPLTLKILQSGGTYLQIGTYNTSVAAGTYQLETGIQDVAGIWAYCKLVVDMYNKVYVSAQFNENFYDLSSAGTFGNQPIDNSADTGTRALHFSTEYAQQSALTTSRFINIGQVVGTME